MNIEYVEKFIYLFLPFSLSFALIIYPIQNRAITSDGDHSEIDDGLLTSAKIVNNIRDTMRNTNIVQVRIHAYIIPSIDAHQVSYLTRNKTKDLKTISIKLPTTLKT